MRLALLLLLAPVAVQEPSPSPSPAATAESPPPAAAAPSPDAPRVAGRDVPWPKRTKSVKPAYPLEAQAIGQRGIVIVQLVVGTDGKVVSADVVRSVPPFDEPALAAVREWEYEVTRVDGRPVPVLLTIPITFAMQLPEVTREPGVPEMRQGVAPVFPAGATEKQARVTASLSLDREGQVREAAITAGSPPFAESLLQAVRTWAFVAPPEAQGVSFDVEAVFNAAGKDGPRVQLRLYGVRQAAVPVETAAPSTAATPAAVTASPAAAPPERTATTAPPTSQSAPPSPAAPPPTATPAPPAGDAAGPPRTTVAAPPVEVVPAPPAPKPTDTAIMEPGVSAVRDVTLGSGVPDLTSGRRPLVPPLARMEGVTGQVEVRFVVEASGATSNLDVTGPERLKEAARQTVSSWTFRRTSTERLFLVATLDYGAETARAAVKRQG